MARTTAQAGRRPTEHRSPHSWFALLRASVQDDVEQRGALPDLTESQILDWADAYRKRTGRWPTCRSGAISTSSGETWQAVQEALRVGMRGLGGGSSLARLLAKN